MAEGKRGNKQLCELVKFLDAMGYWGIADEDDITTGENLNRLMKGVQKFFPDIEIPVKYNFDGESVGGATETDTTTGADLNRLIAGVKGILPDIVVDDAADWEEKTGANLNSLFAAIIKSVAGC